MNMESLVLKFLQAQNRDMMEELFRTKTALGEQESNFELILGEKEALRNNLETLNSNMTALQDDYGKLQTKLQNYDNLMSEKVSKYEMLILEKETTIEQLNNLISLLRNEVESGKTEVQRLNAKLKVLENELSQVSDRPRTVSFNKNKMAVDFSVAQQKIIEAERSADFERALQSELETSKRKFIFLEKELSDFKSKAKTLEDEGEEMAKQLKETKSENCSLKDALASLKQEMKDTVRHYPKLGLDKKLLEFEGELGSMEKRKEAITEDLLMEAAKGKQEMEKILDDARPSIQKIQAETEVLHDWNKNLDSSYKKALETTDIVQLNIELEKLLNVKFGSDISGLIQSQIESELNLKHLSGLPSFFFCARLLWRLMANISNDS